MEISHVDGITGVDQMLPDGAIKGRIEGYSFCLLHFLSMATFKPTISILNNFGPRSTFLQFLPP